MKGKPQPSCNRVWKFGELFKIAYSLSCTAKLIAVMTPALTQIAKEFMSMTPEILEGTVAFRKFIEFVDKLQEEKVENLKAVVELQTQK